MRTSGAVNSGRGRSAMNKRAALSAQANRFALRKTICSVAVAIALATIVSPAFGITDNETGTTGASGVTGAPGGPGTNGGAGGPAIASAAVGTDNTANALGGSGGSGGSGGNGV